MKKLSLLVCLICVFLSMGLTACGSTAAKIYGIEACIDLPENHGVGIVETPLSDKTTLIKNDYILEVEKEYDLRVDYIAGGGSKYPVLFAEDFILKYDADIFDIKPVYDENCLADNKPLKYYTLICKRAVLYATIIIEAKEQYSCNVIISANQGTL